MCKFKRSPKQKSFKEMKDSKTMLVFLCIFTFMEGFVKYVIPLGLLIVAIIYLIFRYSHLITSALKVVSYVLGSHFFKFKSLTL